MKLSFLGTAIGLLLINIPNLCLAQDPRERTYYYEIPEPNHEPKPQIEGYARERVTENLNRGLTAGLAQDGKSVYLSWRLLESDPEDVAFNLYRSINGKAKRLNGKPVKQTCDFMDSAPNGEAIYWVTAVVNRKEQAPSLKIRVCPEKMHHPDYTSIKLNDPDSKAGKIALADLDGDGSYDYIIRTPSTNVDPGMPGDLTGKTYQIEAYRSDGAYLWTRDLGQGIEPGVWYSPFIAYDFNGDGKAEVALKTAPETTVRDDKGRVGGGEEYLTVLDGMTGKEIARADWPERNHRYGNLNRQNRNQIGMAFLDGKTPFILAARGTYRLMVIDAWMLKGDRLERVWRWDGDEENPVVRSMGSHSMICADIDGDGRDEIIPGSCAIDDNGTLLWSTGLGHPDKIYLTDIDPRRPGMELFLCLEPWHDNGRGVCTVNPKDGKPVWNIGHKTFHVGDGMVTDFDPAHPGLECFAAEDRKGGSDDKYLLTADGQTIGHGDDVPPCRNWVWWDADLLRETFRGDNNRRQSIIKWKGETLTESTEGDILMIADMDGDWREEVITALPGELRVYRTRIPAKDRRVTLMQDPLYRNYVAHRSMGYPQAPVPSYYLGE
jgi:rhamnogalacturonan endolyase